jgi:hypothetical protein
VCERKRLRERVYLTSCIRQLMTIVIVNGRDRNRNIKSIFKSSSSVDLLKVRVRVRIRVKVTREHC